MTMPWFRWYGGTCEDGKFREVARMVGSPLSEINAVWALTLEGANAHEKRGHCKYDEKYIAAVYEIEPSHVRAILKAMEELFLLDRDEDGLFVSNWGKRQFKSDDATGRYHAWKAGKTAPAGTRKAKAVEADTPQPAPEPESFPDGYVFEGKVIRLTHKDFHAWSTAYTTEPDIRKWLRERDEWLSTLKKNDNRRKNWFMSTSGDLHRRHRERTVGLNMAGSASPI